MKILECSSKGDKRYSALFAKAKLFEEEKTIEEWYQLSKKFNNRICTTWKEAKQRSKFGKPTSVVINNVELEIHFLTPWYRLLWLLYLDANPKLVEYASKFDDYNDMFKGKSVNCQADVIRQYIKVGRDSIIQDINELIKKINLEVI